MSAQQEKAVQIRPAVAGSVISSAHSTTAARKEIPPDWYDNDVTFYSDTDTLYVSFGDSGVMVDASAAAVVSGETVAPHAGSGWKVGDKGVVTFKMPPFSKDAPTHFAHDSSAATSTWEAYRSSGNNSIYGEGLPVSADNPLLWMDAMVHPSLTIPTGVEVLAWQSSHKTTGVKFTEASTGPDWLNAASCGLPRPTLDFVAASSEKLTSTDASLVAALSGTGAFTLAIAFSYESTAALQTLFSVGTTGSANGRFDVSVDASDNLLITRVTSAGASTTSVGGTTVTDANHLLVITFDGATPLAWLDRTSEALTGTAAGDVGTLTRAGIGARTYNTSTNDQFWNAEVGELLLWTRALGANAVSDVHAWLKRRVGV